MTTINLGPWPDGINNVTVEDTQLRRTEARDIVDGDVDDEGLFRRRPAMRLALAGPATSDVWTSPAGLGTFARQGATLGRVSRFGNAVTFDPIYTLPSNAEKVTFTELNNRVVFCTRSVLGKIEPDDSIRLIGTPDASQPTAAPEASGGLYGYRALVAISYLNAYGEEGALSQIVPVDVPEGGGIRLTMPPAPAEAVTTRIYRTGKSGKLRWAADAPAAMTSYLLGAGKLKKVADTQFKHRMMGGDYVSAWRGRLLVARGRYLFYSDAMRYGLTDPRHNHATFPRRIVFVCGLDGGVFVGLRDHGVFWLGGQDPDQWTTTNTGSAIPVPGSGIIARSDKFDPQLQLPSGELAIWLSENGYVIGQPTGAITQPQASRIRLPMPVAGSLAVLGRRILSVVQ